MADLGRLMGRLGTVVDVAGRPQGQVIRNLAAAAPTGILDLKDAAAVPVPEMAAALGLEFHAQEVARRLADKLLQRRALRSAGVPTPEFEEVSADPAMPDIDRLEREVGFPSVLKPRQGNSSRNAYFAHNWATSGVSWRHPVPGHRSRRG